MTTHRQKHLYPYLTIFAILVGFALRAGYLRQSHPYIDEYFTILATRQVQQMGYPLLPSGLFYSHGLLYTYLMALLGGLLNLSGTIAQAELVYRLPNLLISVLSMATLLGVTRRWFGWPAGLIALTLFAVFPHSIVWGARVRMYTLLFAWTPLLAYVFYQYARHPHRWRYFFISYLSLLLGALTHNWVLLLAPPLLIGMLFVRWQSERKQVLKWPWWAANLASVAGIGLVSSYLQSLWLEIPTDAAQNRGWQGALDAIVLRLNPLSNLQGQSQFINQFVLDNGFNLLILAVTLSCALALWPLFRAGHSFFQPMAYLYLLFLGTAAEFLLLLEPALQQPRYASPLLLLAFIILGGWGSLALVWLANRLRLSAAWRPALLVGALVIVWVGLGMVSARQLPKIFFEGLPAVAYEKAFQYIQAQAAPADAVLTPLPAAATLYLDNPLFFAAQNAVYTFLHLNTAGVMGDRWVGAPWLETPQQFKEVLQSYPVTWLAIDQYSLNSQFGGVWLQLLNRNAQQVWSEDGVTVFRAEGLQADLPTEPAVSLEAQLADKLRLTGYSREISPAGVRLVLFWQVLASPGADYTTFVHIRDSAGQTVAQIDVQPLGGAYPTGRWQPGETVIDEIVLPLPSDFPPDTYRLVAGLYRWDTLERLPVVDDETGENAILLETFTLTPTGVQ